MSRSMAALAGGGSRASGGRAAWNALMIGSALVLAATAATSAAQAPAPASSAPAATALRLTGVVTSAAAGLEQAIIAPAGGAERTYRIGDALPDGSTLGAIDADRVIVRRDGRERVIGLESFQEALPLPPPAVRASSPRASRAQEVAIRRSAAAVRANPVLLLQLLPVQAVMDQHRMVALRVGNAADEGLASELQLAPGDVITAINGVDFNGPDPYAWTRTPADAPKDLALTVYRDGRTRTLRY